MSITNYTELQQAVADWLNRSDLTVRIPDFIRLAESEIFRFFAARGNETSLEVDRTGEDPVTDVIAVPSTYREMLTFTCDGRPLVRRSLTSMQALRVNTVLGWPEFFARELDEFVLYPFPDSGRIYEMNYYAKLLPLGDDDSDPPISNIILTGEPGLYLYGALVQAEPFLRGNELQRLQVWKGQYESIMVGIGLERDEEDRSGSNVSVQSAFGSGPTTSQRRGWA